MDKQTQFRDELDEWLAEGKIDRSTYDRLLAEQVGEPNDPVSSGVMTGAAGMVLGMAIGYLLMLRYDGEPGQVSQASLFCFLALGTLGVGLVRGGWCELGRSIAVAGSSLWTLAVLLWCLADFPPDNFYLSTVFLILAAGHFALGYLSTSALVVFKGCTWLVPAVSLYLAEWNDGRFGYGEFLLAFAGLGGLFLVAAREHLVLRRPARVSLRFAMAYHVAGLSLINWVAYGLAWFGWSGEGYADVTARLIGVTLTVVLYGLEVWAGQNSRMPWVSSMGVLHFLLQVTAILGYPHISLQHRALLIIGFALLLIFVAQGDGTARRSGRA